MKNVEATVISQYATSPTITALIKNFNRHIDPRADLEAFYTAVWNIDTAVGFGLDCWGKIVGLDGGRYLKVAGAELNVGFGEAGVGCATPFGGGTFYSGTTISQNYALADDAFRTLILVKALANISDCSIQSINRLLQNLFAGRGRCYVNDLGGMQLRYTFEFYMTPVEVAIMSQSGALPRPTGVGASILQVQLPAVMGFSEAGPVSAAPFGQGTLFTGAHDAV